MPIDDVGKIRNVAMLGQGSVGKTSLADALLFAAGKVKQLGRVDDGSSLFDFEPEETRHKVSISTALHHLSWKKHEVTIVDTPGYASFLSESRQALCAVDGGVLVLSPSGQVKVELAKLWEAAAERNIGCIGFITHLDREAGDVESALQQVSTALGVPAVALAIPIGAEAGLQGYVDLLRERAVVFTADTGQSREDAIPANLADVAKRLRDKLVEAIAEASDDLLEKYLENGSLSAEEIQTGLRAGTIARKFVPVLCGASSRVIGVHALLDAVVDCLASPLDMPAEKGANPKTGDEIERAADPSAPFSAFVWKTLIDPFAGKLSIFRVRSGRLRGDATALNATRDSRERIGHLFKIEGKKQTPVDELVAGEIGATAKLKDTLSGDTLCDEKEPIVYSPLPDSPPAISFAIEPKSKGDEEKANQALHRLLEEDLALRMHRDPQTREIILSGAGQQHVEIVVERLKRKFGVEVELKAPKVPYRETIKGKSSSQGKYKKQSGGRGQYGDCWLEVEPLVRGSGFEFVDKIVGGVIPRNFIPAVEKGVREAMSEGHVAGYPMQDVRVTLYDGSFHTVDSSEMAFKIAASMGFKAAVEKAKPILLEPVMKLEITTPDDSMGDVIGDLNSRRGKVSQVVAKSGAQVIHASVPMAEVLRYASDLRSMTSGRGSFTMELAHYEEVPAHLVPKIVEVTKAAREGGKS
jgi:elongation factor G